MRWGSYGDEDQPEHGLDGSQTAKLAAVRQVSFVAISWRCCPYRRTDDFDTVNRKHETHDIINM